MKYLTLCVFVFVSLVSGCSNADVKETKSDVENIAEPIAATAQEIDFEQLRHKITYSQASLAEVRVALSSPDKYMLTNIVHALYSMRWLRGVQHILDKAWNFELEKNSGINHELLQEAPVRLALASTLNRIHIIRTDAYLEYIRAHKFDADEFNQAQVVVALGFNGDPADLDYMKSMADGDKPYVVQSAITGLALIGGNQARDAMIELWKKYRDKPRGKLILELLDKSYKWRPEKQSV